MRQRLLTSENAGRTAPEVFVHALSVAFVVAAAIALAGALTAAALVRTHAQRDVADKPASLTELPLPRR